MTQYPAQSIENLQVHESALLTSDHKELPPAPRGNGSGLGAEELPFDLDQPVQRLDARLLKEIFRSALYWLEEHVALINALNVFPVPDGDTGTNMLMTMRSAIKQASQSDASPSTAEIARHLAQGAVRGARGNSGVILSQIINGFAREAENREFYTADDLARAFRRACESAYSAVMKPVEGTILTVMRAVAEAAEEAAKENSDIRMLLNHATAAARQALQRTPDLLPILKEAGVVDSGGQGLVTILEGMSRYLRGEKVKIHAHDEIDTGAVAIDLNVQLDSPPAPLADGRYGYDIQFLIHGQNLDVDAIRAQINQMGDCPLVVGSSDLVKVHVHALSPAPALDYGASLGMLDDIVVENMDLQFEAFVQKRAEVTTPPSLTTEAITGVGIVAVAAGEGLSKHFRALGASAVVTGGQSMNPSTDDLLAAIHAVAAEALIVLPNNKNILMTARQAQDLADKPVYVVPTRTAPQGFAALMALDYSADAETNAATMCEAMHQVVTVEVTTAVRTTTINNVAVQEGQQIGLLDGQLVAAGTDDLSVIQSIFAEIDLENYEIVVLYYGEERNAADAEEMVAALEETYPDLGFEVHDGGQPHYTYILSVE